MLKDTSTYRQVPGDSTVTFQKELKSLLNKGIEMGVLSQPDAEKLFVIHPVTPIFHSLHKFHKGVFSPPLRPIVVGIGSMWEKLSAWVDAFLQLLVTISPAYIRDTKHCVSLLDGQTWHEGLTWLSCDVTTLYPSIPQSLAVEVDTYSSFNSNVKEFLLSIDFSPHWLVCLRRPGRNLPSFSASISLPPISVGMADILMTLLLTFWILPYKVLRKMGSELSPTENTPP